MHNGHWYYVLPLAKRKWDKHTCIGLTQKTKKYNIKIKILKNSVNHYSQTMQTASKQNRLTKPIAESKKPTHQSQFLVIIRVLNISSSWTVKKDSDMDYFAVHWDRNLNSWYFVSFFDCGHWCHNCFTC